MGRLKPLDFRENLPVPTDGQVPLNLSYAMAFAVTMRVWIWHIAHRRLTSFLDTACISKADTLTATPAIYSAV